MTIINGNSGNNTLNGTPLGDFIYGFAGNDIIFGNGGHDVIEGGADNDTMDGGIGIDTASYASATAGVIVNLTLSGSQNTEGAGFDTLSNFENITGSAHKDALTGDSGDNVIHGGGGNDTIRGGDGGLDQVFGDEGDDHVILDRLPNGSHFDGGLGLGDVLDLSELSLPTDEGFDVRLRYGVMIYQNAAQNTITGFEQVDGSSGNDILDNTFGGGGANSLAITLRGLGGDDYLRGDLADILYGGDDDDELYGFRAEYISGGEGDDYLEGGGHTNWDDPLNPTGFTTMKGGTGDDTYHVPTGDTVPPALIVEHAGEGYDTIIGRFHSNPLTRLPDHVERQIGGYGIGNDLDNALLEISGTWADGKGGDDYMEGSATDNVLDGGDGLDHLVGGGGNDTLKLSEVAVGDVEILDGGDDHDLADFSAFGNAVWVDLDYTGPMGYEAWTRDNLTVTSGPWRALADLSNIEGVLGSAFDDELYGDSGINTLGGGSGADLLIGYGGGDTFLHTGGFDNVSGGSGEDTSDFSRYATAVWVDLAYTGATGYEAWTTGTSHLNSGTWQAIADLGSIEHTVGSDFDDKMWGDDTGNILKGGLGINRLYGRDGDDTFLYEEDIDPTFGGTGIRQGFDHVYGGAGVDTVDFSAYSHAVWIDLTYSGSTGFEAWTQSFSTVNNNQQWTALANLDSIEHVIGTAFSDAFYDGLGNDAFEGGAGADLYALSGGFDTVTDSDAPSGVRDTVDFSEYATAVWVDLSYSGPTGFEAWTRGGASVDSGTWQAIADLTGIENITGSAFDDILFGDESTWNEFRGGSGDDVMIGEGGGDLFYFDAIDGFDTIDGGTGINYIDFSDYEAAVWVDLAYTGATGFEAWTQDDTDLSSGAWRAIADIQNVRHITGSDFDDELTGDASNNRLNGGAGNNILTGGDGNDIFEFSALSNPTTIADFQDTGSGFEDQIDLSQLGVGGFQDLSIAVINGDTLIATQLGSVITLVGITSGIDAGDFWF